MDSQVTSRASQHVDCEGGDMQKPLFASNNLLQRRRLKDIPALQVTSRASQHVDCEGGDMQKPLFASNNLLQRRRLKDIPALQVPVYKVDPVDEPATAEGSTSESPSPFTSTSSSTSVTSPVDEAASQRDVDDDKAKSERTSLLQRRGRPFRPVLNCKLVEAESHSPFKQPQCMGLSEHYVVHEALGQGSTAVVYRAQSRSNKQREVALKVMRLYDEELLATARSEFELMRSIDHLNVVRALDFFTYPQGAVLVTEYFKSVDLEAAILRRRGRCLEEETSRCLILQLLQAVAHLHAVGIVHRDIKCPNILVSEDLTDLKLTDFNTASRMQEGGLLTVTGTLEYWPPEAFYVGSPGRSGDVWAVGLCLHAMLFGRLPWERKNFRSNHEFAAEVAQGVRLPSLGCSIDGRGAAATDEQLGPWHTLLTSCLEVNPERRLTAAEALNDEWLRGRWV